MIINACPHDTGPDRHVIHAFKRCNRCVDPFLNGLSFNLAAIHDSATTPMGSLFDQQNLCAGFPSGQSRLDTCNTTANDNHIVERIKVFVAVRITRFGIGGFAQSCRMTDEGLIHVLPQRARMNEHLVVEPCRQEARQVVVDLAHVELKARPVVLAGGVQTVKQLGRGCTLVRLKRVAFAQIDQCVRLFRATGHGATRTVILETPAHHHLVVRQKRRRQRVAFVTSHLLAVETE